MDTLTPKDRSRLMAKIKSKDTTPELCVRSLLHRLGYRFRLHRNDLPGKPDIVLPKHKKIILVQGCFWHGHDCKLASKPKSNQDYWGNKIRKNRERDEKNLQLLKAAGWSVLLLWECDIRKFEGLETRLKKFLSSGSA